MAHDAPHPFAELHLLANRRVLETPRRLARDDHLAEPGPEHTSFHDAQLWAKLETLRADASHDYVRTAGLSLPSEVEEDDDLP